MSSAPDAIRTLLVDDHADLRLVVRRILELHGSFIIVGEAADGAEGEDCARRLQPDLVLLDLDMPRVGGLEALPGIREAAPDTKIVVLSGLARQDMESQSLGLGAVGYLQKGLPASRLVEELVAITGVMATVDDVVAEVRERIEGEPRTPGIARRFVDQALERWDCGEVLDNVRLLVSEVVTNAVLHAGSEIELAVELRPFTVRVSVADGSDAQPTRRLARTDEESGRGLELVDVLAQSWGVEPRPGGGKIVWFEVPRGELVGEANR